MPTAASASPAASRTSSSAAARTSRRKKSRICLREHAAVADAYVYGLADAFFGEAVAAAVRLKPSSEAKAEELVAVVRVRRSRNSKCRSYVRFVAEFPMTASGKIQKFRLRDWHEDWNCELRTQNWN